MQLIYGPHTQTIKVKVERKQSSSAKPMSKAKKPTLAPRHSKPIVRDSMLSLTTIRTEVC
jgi:hypothetical protein